MQKAVEAALKASAALGVDVTVDNYDEVINRAANWQLWSAIDDSLTHVAEQERDEEYYLENLQLMQEKLEEVTVIA